jgi:phosphomannomutase
MEIFKSLDIRGIYPNELNEEIAYKIGRAFIALFKVDKVVVGRDARLSSNSLFKALTDGITDQGADVVDLGLCTTPMLYFAGQKYPASIMITASHNPHQFNGFKLCREKAIPISGETGIKQIKELVMKNKFPDAEKKGEIVQQDFSEEYSKHVLQFSNMKKRLKVVTDVSNGSSGAITSKVFEKIDCEVIKLNFEPDGHFPNHEPNQLIDKNYKQLIDAVKENNADFGIMYDGDADRVGFVDEKGEIIHLDMITALIAIHLLKERPNEKIVYEVRSSWAVREEILENKGIPLLNKSGHTNIANRMRKENAIFGGEKSGHFYFRENFFADDALIATMFLLNEVSMDERTMSEIINPLKRYHDSGEINSAVQNADEIIKKAEEKYKDGSIKHIDGITVEFEDWWFNLRKSQTEPLLRLIVEAKTKELMEEKKAELLKLIRE